MSLKQEIETWVEALAHYDNNEFEEALKTFDPIADTSRILFNCGVIHATLGEHERAVDCYQRAVRLDQYLAVAYFQQGVSNFLIGDFEEALANFNDTLLYLRGNTSIDYDQLGLKFKLFSCEVLFNRGLCYIYLQQKDDGMQDFSFAVKEKVVEDHNVIDEAILEEAEGYTVFSIPVGVVYRPHSAKVKNLKTKDYLGKARLVAATSRSNAFTGFAGAEFKRNALPTDMVRDDRPAESISFAASNLVKPGLRSRTRQQSEPPLNRQVFPPTPPPESDKVLPFRRGSNELDRSFSFNRSNTTASPEIERSSSNRIVELEKPSFSRSNTATTTTSNNESVENKPQSSSGHNSFANKDLAERREMVNMKLQQHTKPPPLTRTNTDTSTTTVSTSMTDRAASVRGGKGRPDNLLAASIKTPIQSAEPLPPPVAQPPRAAGADEVITIRERPRLGTMRTASEPRGPSSRSYSTSRGGGAAVEYLRPRMMSRERAPSRRRQEVLAEEGEVEDDREHIHDQPRQQLQAQHRQQLHDQQQQQLHDQRQQQQQQQQQGQEEYQQLQQSQYSEGGDLVTGLYDIYGSSNNNNTTKDNTPTTTSNGINDHSKLRSFSHRRAASRARRAQPDFIEEEEEVAEEVDIGYTHNERRGLQAMVEDEGPPEYNYGKQREVDEEREERREERVRSSSRTPPPRRPSAPSITSSSQAPSQRRPSGPSTTSSSQPPSQRRPSAGSVTPITPPLVQKIRVKVHVGPDTRYIVLPPPSTSSSPSYHPPTTIKYGHLISLIHNKFNLLPDRPFRCTIFDAEDGDRITLGDQDDLDLAVDGCLNVAKAEADASGAVGRKEVMGKLEVWVVDY